MLTKHIKLKEVEFMNWLKARTFIIIAIIILMFSATSKFSAANQSNIRRFTVEFQSQSLLGALKQIEQQTESKIKIYNDKEADTLISMKIEDSSLSEIIDHVLKRFRVKNFSLTYGSDNRVVEIKSFASSSRNTTSPSEHHAALLDNPSDTAQSERMFTIEDFDYLQTTINQNKIEKQLTNDDFELLVKKQGEKKKTDKLFSSDDFNHLLLSSNNAEKYPELSQNTFLRIRKSKKQNSNKLFSDKDFHKLIAD